MFSWPEETGNVSVIIVGEEFQRAGNEKNGQGSRLLQVASSFLAVYIFEKILH